MKKIIMVVGAIIIGLLFSKLIFNQYKSSPVDMVVKKYILFSKVFILVMKVCKKIHQN